MCALSTPSTCVKSSCSFCDSSEQTAHQIGGQTTEGAQPHLLVSTGGADTGFVDGALAKLGKSRRVALTVPAFIGAPTIVSQTDLISTVPRAIGEFGRERLGIVLRPVPIEMPRAEAYVWWHQRLQNEPGHRWWRRMLIEAFAPFNTPAEQTG